MADMWCPFATRDPAPTSFWGTWSDTGEPKGLLHTVEGHTYNASSSTYYGHNNWPHMTLVWKNDWRDFTPYQHIPANYSARALRNLAGGVQTNRDNVFQIEIAWYAKRIRELPDKALQDIAKVMRWAEAANGIPRKTTVTFKAYPSSYGNNGVRLSGPAFDAYTGWLGHQHAPENDHGDPGDIRIDYLLNYQLPQKDRKTHMFIVHPEGASALYLVRGDKITVISSEKDFWQLSSLGIGAVPISAAFWAELQK